MTILDYIYDSFIEFLKSYNVLEDYDNGIFHNREITVYNKHAILLIMGDDIINRSFCWAETPISGETSWRVLNAEWVNKFKKLFNDEKVVSKNFTPLVLYYTYDPQIKEQFSNNGYCVYYTVSEFNHIYTGSIQNNADQATIIADLSYDIVRYIKDSKVPVVFKELSDSNIILSTNLFTLALNSFDKKISTIVYKIYEDVPLNYIDIDSKTGKVSYLLKDKIKEVPKEDIYTTSKRTTTTIGKLLMKLDFEKVLDKCDIERISNYFKGIFRKITVEVLEGESIKIAYLEDNYAPQNGCIVSTLHRSCMRHSECQSYFDFYIAAHAKIAVLFNEKRQIEARALLWQVGPNKYYLDRVYSTTPFINLKFVNAVKDKYNIDYYRIDGKVFDANTNREVPEGVRGLNYIIVTDELKDYEGQFPYCDSFYVFIKSLGALCTPNIKILHGTDGEYSNPV